MLLRRTKSDVNDAIAAVQLMYKLLGNSEIRTLLETLEKYDEIRSSELMKKSHFEKETSFYSRINQLVDIGFVERHINDLTRHITYKFTSFGRELLILNKPLLEKAMSSLPRQDQLIETEIMDNNITPLG